MKHFFVSSLMLLVIIELNARPLLHTASSSLSYVRESFIAELPWMESMTFVILKTYLPVGEDTILSDFKINEAISKSMI